MTRSRPPMPMSTRAVAKPRAWAGKLVGRRTGGQVAFIIVGLLLVAFGAVELSFYANHRVTDAGAGTAYGPYISYGSHNSSQDGIHVRIDATGKVYSDADDDVDPIYDAIEASPSQAIPVQVKVDSGNDLLNTVTFDGRSYDIESSQTARLIVGIVPLVLGLALAGVNGGVLIRSRRATTWG